MNASSPNTQSSHEAQSAWPMFVAVVVIVFLVGLLLPALRSGLPHPISQVKTEISALEGAITEFKNKFGIDPPSGVTIHTDSEGWNSDPQSKQFIRKLFPHFDFSGSGGLELTAPQTLDGAECLVFFLGGVQSGGAFIGFSKNPANPFSKEGKYRIGPFYEFNLSRITDTDGDKAQEYLDPISGQTKPYLYLSSYYGIGNGYRITDAGGRMSDIYTQRSTGDSWKPHSYQIISPGFDKEYGPGGVYDPLTADADLVGPREAERDNITNFAAGRMVD